MSFIDYTYFRGDLQIPNLDKDTSSFQTSYIDKYEKEMLICLLGYDLYKQLIDNYDTGVDDQWKNLAEGAEFTVERAGVNYDIKWEGFTNSEKESPIAYYVYYQYVKQNYRQLTGLGVGAQNMENAETIDPNEKMVWSWNKFVDLYGKYEYEFHGDNNQSFTYDSLEQSAFNYIVHNIADYPQFVFQPKPKQNLLGI